MQTGANQISHSPYSVGRKCYYAFHALKSTTRAPPTVDRHYRPSTSTLRHYSLHGTRTPFAGASACVRFRFASWCRGGRDCSSTAAFSKCSAVARTPGLAVSLYQPHGARHSLSSCLSPSYCHRTQCHHQFTGS